jgi:hypothetical protein
VLNKNNIDEAASERCQKSEAFFSKIEPFGSAFFTESTALSSTLVFSAREMLAGF